VRAVAAHGPGDFRLEEVEAPVLPDDGLLVEVEATGVCAADRMLWSGRHPWGELAWPFIPGHELLGRVVAGHLPAGTRVTAEVKLPCGSCASCLRGEGHLCPRGRHLGSGIPGGFADLVALPASTRVHIVPDGLDRDQAVLAEPMACALHAVRRSGVREGDRVLIAGIGGLGAVAVTAARYAGAAHVTALVRTPEKARLARELGYDDAVLDPSADYDVGLDVSGSVDAVEVLLTAVRAGGRLGVYGVYDRPLTIDLNHLGELGERSLTGGHLAPGCFPEAIALLVQVHDVVTGVHPLESLTEAFTPRPTRLKEIVVP
jgi:2-desacetyl-2-hydroxyethyl bacteriochlorophyllide A dehydrogenase